jgi:N-methylhydantoinase A/oxoprolinase/acetone carboxylase beta subunit
MITDLILNAYGLRNKPSLATPLQKTTQTQELKQGVRVAHFGGKPVEKVPVFVREALPTGFQLHGPAIIVELGSTTVVHPGWEIIVDDFGNLVLVRD